MTTAAVRARGRRRRAIFASASIATILAILAWLGWATGRRPAVELGPARGPRGYLGAVETISAVAFSPDGKTLAAGSYGGDGKVRLWDLASGRERMAIDLGQPVEVRPVAISPDGGALIAGGNLNGGLIQYHTPGAFPKPLRVWDLNSGRQLAALDVGSEDYLRTLRFSADGRTLATGAVVPSRSGGTLVNPSDWREQVTLWDVATWTERSSFTLEPGRIAATAFSADLTTFAAAGLDGVIALHDTADGRPIRTPRAGRAIGALALSADGRNLATLSYGSPATVQFWDLEAGRMRHSRPWPETRHAPLLAFSPDGTTLAMTWTPRRDPVEELPRFVQRAIGLRPRRGSAVVLWDVASGRPRVRLVAPNVDFLADVAFSPDGRTVAAGGFNGGVIFWDVPERGARVRTAPARNGEGTSEADRGRP